MTEHTKTLIRQARRWPECDPNDDERATTAELIYDLANTIEIYESMLDAHHGVDKFMAWSNALIGAVTAVVVTFALTWMFHKWVFV